MQKRHARWIATLAIAGTTAFCGASAAEAATSGAQGPKQVSPATCAGLVADFSATLIQAAKSLMATPPDLAGATAQVTQANKLDEAIKSLGCAAGTTPAPPSVPGAPSLPSLPSVPSLPSLPGGASAPSLPGGASAPSLPGLPGASGLGGSLPVPGLPSL